MSKALERRAGFLVENGLAARQGTASSLRATCWGRCAITLWRRCESPYR